MIPIRVMARPGLLLKATLISCLCTIALAQLSSSYFSRNGTTKTWINNDASLPDTVHFSDGSFARFILLEVVLNPYGFGLCFYCQPSTTYSCYLSIVFAAYEDGPVTEMPPLVVWSANRDQPVGENSALCIDGGLELKDSNGQSIWSTDSASNSSAVGMNMTSLGNLVLLDRTNRTIWQSFDHPTDTLLLGQRLRKGQKLISSMSSEDMGSGLFYLSLDSVALSAYVVEQSQSQSHSTYLSLFPSILPFENLYDLTYIEFGNGNVSFLYEGKTELLLALETPVSSPFQFLRLDVDGGLRIYSWDYWNGWLVSHYFSDHALGECQFPLKCGKYGLCRYGQCTCPVAPDGTRFFAPSDPQHTDHGCQDINVEDDGDDLYELVDFGRLSYFTSNNPKAATPGLHTEESCKEACLRAGMACMAAFFLYFIASSRGYCDMVSQVLSIRETLKSDDIKTSAYIKVRVSSPKQPSILTTLPVALAACALVLLCVSVSLLHRRKRIRRERLYLKKLSENLLRFSYSDLSTATQNFSQKLGGGGFGLVFKGTLSDGREVAVKRLGNDGQGKKEFLAEVETVGKIHHFNLVSLIGFCVENKHMIIVYEYLANGSLDKWIFSENHNTGLDWELRKKIALGVAKGLTYIHEECKQRIAHLDVKPHNILLDDSFNVKISDFGMSKLIDRDESQVMTGIRGTLGYLAPEWQGSRITVKADVYSFGILVLEVVSGRKVLDYSQPESQVHLLKLLKKKCLEDRLRDIVDNRCEDMVSNSEDVVDMIRLAMWCLHSDYKRRPTMSSVVKVLEGSLELEPHFTCNFSSIFSPPCPQSNATASLASNVKPL